MIQNVTEQERRRFVNAMFTAEQECGVRFRDMAPGPYMAHQTKKLFWKHLSMAGFRPEDRGYEVQVDLEDGYDVKVWFSAKNPKGYRFLIAMGFVDTQPQSQNDRAIAQTMNQVKAGKN